MHNLCIFIGVIDGGGVVETIVYVAVAGISVAECDTCIPEHDAWSKISVGLCVEMVEKYEMSMGGFANFAVGEAEERGYLVLLWQPPPNGFHAKEK